jgi:hypothetical protein
MDAEAPNMDNDKEASADAPINSSTSELSSHPNRPPTLMKLATQSQST